MSVLLAIDPSVRGCGAALFDNKVLFAATYVPSPARKGIGPREAAIAARAVKDWVDFVMQMEDTCVREIAAEVPQIYSRGGGKTKADPNQLVPLFGISAALSALYPEAKVIDVQPSTWKGQSSKPEHVDDHEYVITTRVKERLSADELAVIDWTGSVKHSYDVADAIGISLYALGRFERRRAFARE